MMETEWLTSEDPEPMLRFVRPRAGDRSLRLFAVACWYRVWAAQMPAATTDAVELLVRHIDGVVSPGEWLEGFGAAGGANLGKHFRLLICPDALLTAVESARFAAQDLAARQAWDAVEVDVHADAGRRATQSNWRSRFRCRALARERAAQAGLVREVFGNPTREVAFDPAWRTGTAVALAKGMYESRDFSAMPILADALQDAGCGAGEVLGHCREPHGHVRGCWVLDLVRG
ncbi:MAG: hypothetical protein ACKODX_07580 [Gemmata sp.]